VSHKCGEIIQFYAEHFTKNDKVKAERQLDNHNYEVRRKDAILISFFCGTISIIIFMFIVLLSIPDSALDKKGTKIVSSAQELASSMYTFRFLFMMIFTVAAAGVVIKTLKSIRVNYMYIFELDP
jgi:hypothetical protein